jgi:hypothetical protein
MLVVDWEHTGFQKFWLFRENWVVAFVLVISSAVP